MQQPPFDIVALEIGKCGDLSRAAAKRAARNFRQMIAEQPTAVIWLAIYGYDDDPRRLWEIQEARHYL
jgi:hypothetical protein